MQVPVTAFSNRRVILVWEDLGVEIQTRKQQAEHSWLHGSKINC